MLIQPSVHAFLLRARISRSNTQHANNTQQGATANVKLERMICFVSQHQVSRWLHKSVYPRCKNLIACLPMWQKQGLLKACCAKLLFHHLTSHCLKVSLHEADTSVKALCVLQPFLHPSLRRCPPTGTLYIYHRYSERHSDTLSI